MPGQRSSAAAARTATPAMADGAVGSSGGGGSGSSGVPRSLNDRADAEDRSEPAGRPGGGGAPARCGGNGDGERDAGFKLLVVLIACVPIPFACNRPRKTIYMLFLLMVFAVVLVVIFPEIALWMPE